MYKFQLAVDLTGVPIWEEGPNPGRDSDIELWRNHRPLLRFRPGERWLADKAYTSRDLVEIAQQYKVYKSESAETKRLKKFHNKVHGFYRAVVEHTFGKSYSKSANNDIFDSVY